MTHVLTTPISILPVIEDGQRFFTNAPGMIVLSAKVTSTGTVPLTSSPAMRFIASDVMLEPTSRNSVGGKPYLLQK